MNRQLIKDYAKKMGKELNRKVTLAEAEVEIVRVMQKVARVLAPSYRFGYHSNEDMEQEGIQYALIVLESNDKYDINQPLENFLYTHIHNRLYNYKRKHYTRLEPPCSCCDPFNPPAYPCQKWLDWKSRNSSKQNIMQPLDMSNISDESEHNMYQESEVIDNTIGSELRTLLDRELPVELRRDYLQMIDGKVIPKIRRDKVREAVLSITKEKGYLDAQEEKSN